MSWAAMLKAYCSTFSIADNGGTLVYREALVRSDCLWACKFWSTPTSISVVLPLLSCSLSLLSPVHYFPSLCLSFSPLLFPLVCSISCSCAPFSTLSLPPSCVWLSSSWLALLLGYCLVFVPHVCAVLCCTALGSLCACDTVQFNEGMKKQKSKTFAITVFTVWMLLCTWAWIMSPASP